ncbi:MAG TPA: Ig-like domain-containing protein, partial [Rhodanobacter sp.]|nr:Ig-like domain-containing protein [Rhodanobacter sp.]
MSRLMRKKWLPGALCVALGMTLAGCGGSSNNDNAATPPPPTPAAPGPTVVSVTPANAATGVPNTATVSVTFDQAIDPATLDSTSFSVTCPIGAEPFGSVTYDDAKKTATFVRITDKPTNLPQSEVAEPMPADVKCTGIVKAG